MIDPTAQFESRKQDHIRIALSHASQTPHLAGFDRLQLRHEALPDLNFEDISITATAFAGTSSSVTLSTPFFISSMTAGHGAAVDLNRRLARAAAKRGWMMGVGSQRRELFDPEAKKEWRAIREASPDAVLIGNLGIAQVIQTPIDQVRELVKNLEAQAFFVHLNPLQECLQPEGNLHFQGSTRALENLVSKLGIPIIVKETGCGFSSATLRRLMEMGVYAVDAAGAGGTHWGRVEGLRGKTGDLQTEAAQTFADWGYSTIDTVRSAVQVFSDAKTAPRIWASGGVRQGLDAAKLIALGAVHIGLARPLLERAVQGDEALEQFMTQIEFELKVALFCTGLRQPGELLQKGILEWT